MNGYIKLWRPLLDKPIWLNSTPAQKSILITLLMMANHEEKQWEWNGKKFKALPGQFVTSANSIIKKCGGVTRQNIRSSLQRFKKLDFLNYESTKTGMLITIINWHVYQAASNNAQPTTQPMPNQRPTTNEEGKKDKNINNIRPRLKISDLHISLVEFFRNTIKARKPDYKFTGSIEKWADTIRLMIEQDNRTADTIKTVIEWSQQDNFWQNNILSPDKLRKQFDRLELEMDKDKPKGNTGNKQYDENGICWNSR